MSCKIKPLREHTCVFVCGEVQTSRQQRNWGYHFWLYWPATSQPSGRLLTLQVHQVGQLHFPEHHLVAAAPAEAAREAYMVPGCLLAALGLDLELELQDL